MIILRPTVTVVTGPSGKSFALNVSDPTWLKIYQSVERFPTLKEANKGAKSFSKNFDAECTDIETGVRRPYHVMGSLVADGQFKSKDVVSARFARKEVN